MNTVDLSVPKPHGFSDAPLCADSIFSSLMTINAISIPCGELQHLRRFFFYNKAGQLSGRTAVLKKWKSGESSSSILP